MNIKKKICLSCELEKSINKFTKNSSKQDGRDIYCKVCNSKAGKEYYEKNKEKILNNQNKYRLENKDKIAIKNKNYEINNWNKIKKRKREWYNKNKEKMANKRLKQILNITLEQKNDILKTQLGKCASCGDILGNDKHNIHVDHNHLTGAVRKILCRRCNLALGIMEENVDKILKLAEYAKYCNNIEDAYD
jgi:hypothetical protein